MERSLGTSLNSKAVFVRNPGVNHSGSIPPQPHFRLNATQPDAQRSPFATDRIFSEAVLQWWDLHAGYFGFRPVRDL
jgi:hypothetical protein